MRNDETDNQTNLPAINELDDGFSGSDAGGNLIKGVPFYLFVWRRTKMRTRIPYSSIHELICYAERAQAGPELIARVRAWLIDAKNDEESSFRRKPEAVRRRSQSEFQPR